MITSLLIKYKAAKAVFLCLSLASCTTINVTSDGDAIIDAHKEVITDTAAGL